nr:DUF3560 domain-containing protein [Cellulosimicrobium sp. MM]
MLTITHTREAGTLIDGTERGDGTNVVSRHRWRSRNLGTWYVPQSRDRAAKVPDRDDRGRAARGRPRRRGHHRRHGPPAAVVEADKIPPGRPRRRAGDQGRAQGGAAAAAYARHEAAVERLPEGGEPIKIGHHSEKRHRRDTERAWSTLGTAVHAQRDADSAHQAAATATATTGARYSPVTVGNRIDRLAAEIRKYERELVAPVYDPDTGYRHATEHEQARRRRRLEPAIAEARDNLAHWEGVRAQQIADGAVTDYGPHNVAKGDEVMIGNWWRRVARVNAKSVSVETDYSWTDRAPWHEVTDHRAAQTA